MIEKIRIQNFKNFQDTTIEGFKRINLFGGLNNSGKSNLLEAIFLSTSTTINAFFQLKNIRKENLNFKTEALNFWNSFFYQHRIGIPIEIEVWLEDQTSYLTKTFLKQKNILSNLSEDFIQNSRDNFSVLYYQRFVQPQNTKILDQTLEFLTEASKLESIGEDGIQILSIDYLPSSINYNPVLIAKLFSDLKDKGFAADLLVNIQQVFPNIKELYVSTTGQNHLRIIETQGLNLSLNAYGDALKKMIIVFAQIMSGSRVFLIDEIENGLHYTVQKDFWKMLLNIAKKFDVQIFATTHSMEMIQAFAELEEEDAVYFELTKNQSHQIIAIHREPNLVYSENFIEAVKEQHIRGER